MGEKSLQAAESYLIFILLVRLDELAAGEFGVQSPATSITYCVENNPNILLLGEAFGLFVLFEYPNFNSKK